MAKNSKEVQARADAKRAGKRARAWTALMYQESAPDGWMEKLSNFFDEIGAVMPPEPKAKVKDFKQMARYLCHLDQPSKHRYDTADVKSFGSIDYQALVMSGQDEDEMIDEMCEFIDANMITSFRQFCVYVRNERPEWRVLVYHQYAALLSRYIKSLAWEMEQERRNL